MAENAKNALYKLKTGWKRHEREIILFAGVFLVGVIGFEIGLVEGQAIQSKPLVIEVPVKPVPAQIKDEQSTRSDNGKTNAGAVAQKDGGAVSAADQKCAFVGSKNSTKYHLSTCAVVKRIKPENRVCFTSEEDAKSKGYTAGCLK